VKNYLILASYSVAKQSLTVVAVAWHKHQNFEN